LFSSNCILPTIKSHNFNNVVYIFNDSFYHYRSCLIFDTVKYEEWNPIEGHQVNYQRVHNPECLQPTLVPLEFRQDILKDLVAPNPLFQDILTDSAIANPARLLEQYNYLTEYFKRATIHTDTVDNEMFQQWWAWLAQEVKQ
jgi:hypothetical protein